MEQGAGPRKPGAKLPILLERLHFINRQTGSLLSRRQGRVSTVTLKQPGPESQFSCVLHIGVL